MNSIDRLRHRAAGSTLLVFLACAMLHARASGAQTIRLSPEAILCSWEGRLVSADLTAFPAESAGSVYEQEVDQILGAMVLDRPPNLLVRPVSHGKALATVEVDDEGKPIRRLILYNQQYFAILPQTAGRFARYAVLAHEIGHHLSFHTENQGVNPQREIQADRFAGSVLARLGASLEEATEVLIDVSEHRTHTHPSRAERRAAMVNGWIQQKPEALLGTALKTHLTKIQEAGVQRTSGTFFVDESKPFDGHFLIADRIEFPPGSELVISREALAHSSTFFIVAREIVSDPENPGTITWEKPVPPDPPGSPGQAASGRHGQGDGESGAPGFSGTAGTKGYGGEGAPSLILAVQELGKSKLVVDLEGQGGGLGSVGQRGGDGGNGQRGSHASSSLFECRRGAGDGGHGGPGGPGGPGGTGGAGGRGGNFTLLTDVNLLADFNEQIQIRVAGGEGGLAGVGGEGGSGGFGGPRGAPSLPWCKDDGRDGPRGSQGSPGGDGNPGNRGLNGRFAIGGLTKEQLRALLEIE